MLYIYRANDVLCHRSIDVKSIRHIEQTSWSMSYRANGTRANDHRANGNKADVVAPLTLIGVCKDG